MLMTIAIPYWMNQAPAQNPVPVQNLVQVPAVQVPALAVLVPVLVPAVQAHQIQDQVPHLVEVLLVVLVAVPHLVEVLLVDHQVVLVTLQVSY